MSDEVGTRTVGLEREGSILPCTIDRPGARDALDPARYPGLRRAERRGPNRVCQELQA